MVMMMVMMIRRRMRERQRERQTEKSGNKVKVREFGILGRSVLAEGLLLEPIYYRDHADTCQHLCFYLCHLIRTLSVTQFN